MFEIEFHIKETCSAFYVQLVRKECQTTTVINGSIVQTFIALAKCDSYEDAYRVKRLFETFYLDSIE